MKLGVVAAVISMTALPTVQFAYAADTGNYRRVVSMTRAQIMDSPGLKLQKNLNQEKKINSFINMIKGVFGSYGNYDPQWLSQKIFLAADGNKGGKGNSNDSQNSRNQNRNRDQNKNGNQNQGRNNNNNSNNNNDKQDEDENQNQNNEDQDQDQNQNQDQDEQDDPGDESTDPTPPVTTPTSTPPVVTPTSTPPVVTPTSTTPVASSTPGTNPSTDLPISGNLIANGDLNLASASDPNIPENWSMGVLASGQATFQYPAAGPNGNNAAKVTVTQLADGGAKWAFNHLNVTPGQTYTFRDVYNSTAETELLIEYVMTNGSSTTEHLATLPVSSGWSPSMAAFTVPANAKTVTVFHQIKSVGDLTIDNVSLVLGGNVVAPPVVTPTSTPPVVTPTSTPPIVTPTSTPPVVTPTSTPPVVTPTSTPPVVTPTSTPPVMTPTSTPPVVTPTSTIAGNLIPNPDFGLASPTDPTTPDKWHKGVWGTNQTAFTYPTAGPNGNNAAKIDITQRTDGDAKWWFDHIAVTPGDKYTYSGTYQANVPTTISVEFANASGTNSYLDVASVPAATAWSQVNVTFTVPAGVTSLTVFHVLNSVGSLTIDNLSLVKNQNVPPPTPAPNADPNNLIINASLSTAAQDDSTTPFAWHKGGWGNNQITYGYPVTGYDGNSGIQIQLSNYTDGDAKWYFDPVLVTGYENFEFTDYYKSDVPSVITAQFSLPNGTYSYADVAFPAAAADWTPVTAKFSAPVGATAMTVFHLIKQNGTLATSAPSLKLLPSMALNQGMVTLSFDDGYKSVYDNARPILDAAGYKPTLYIITGPDGLDNSPDYMTTEEVQQLYANGYEIGSHTRSHAHLPLLTADQMTAEISGARQDLMALGFTPAETFAYPYGEYDINVIQAVKDAGYVGARSVNQGFNDKTSDPFLLMDQHVEKNVTPDQVKGWIDQALLNKQWLILEFHDQNANGDTWSNSPATLQAIVDYLKQRNAKVVTVSQGLQLIKQ